MKNLILTVTVIILFTNTSNLYADVCSNNATICINNEMPLWNQGSESLRNYINNKEKINVESDPGWCGMVSSAMFLRAIGLTKRSGAKMGGIWDESNSRSDNSFIYEAGKAVRTDFDDGGTSSSNALRAIVDIRRKSTLNSSTPWYLFWAQRGKFDEEVWENISTTPYSIKSRIKKYGQISYIGVGIYDKVNKIKSRRVCTWKWRGIIPYRQCSTQYYLATYYVRDGGHNLVLNGVDGRYFKIYDPWGRIYNVSLKNEEHTYEGSSIKRKMRFSHLAGSGYGFAEAFDNKRLFLDSYISWTMR